MTEQPRDDEQATRQDEQVPGGTLEGNEEGASSDGDTGPSGAGGGSRDDEASGS